MIIRNFSERKVSEMICLNCGKEIENDIRVCPFCGNLVEIFDDSVYFEETAPEYKDFGNGHCAACHLLG